MFSPLPFPQERMNPRPRLEYTRKENEMENLKRRRDEESPRMLPSLADLGSPPYDYGPSHRTLDSGLELRPIVSTAPHCNTTLADPSLHLQPVYTWYSDLMTSSESELVLVPSPPPTPKRSVRQLHHDYTPLPNAPKHKRAKLSDEDQGNEVTQGILDALSERPRSDLVHGNSSIYNLVKQVSQVLSKSNISDQLRDLSVEEAQCTLDFLQNLLDVPGIPVISKRILLKTSLRLTRTHDCVPRCLVLRGFKKTGDHAFALGHFGELWRGEIEGVEVAVKQARIFTSDNNIKKVLRQVRREAIVWRQCDHPNVLPFYGIFCNSDPSTYCLVSPFMVNGSLRQYINRTVYPDRRGKLALDITRGMDYLHTLSIVHGDLKGDNVLITDDYRAVIADFGISFVMGGTTFATSSSSSSRKGGTVRWQAPEVLRGSPNSFSADVYSLACVYFEVFDGSIPWSGLNDAAVAITVCHERKHLPPPRNLATAGFSDLWWKLMVQCWAHKPLDRPTLRGLMKSLHAGDTLPPVRKWDNPALSRLRDPLVHGELYIPSGLPPFLDINGDDTTASMTLLDNSSILDSFFPPEFDLDAFLRASFSNNMDSSSTSFEDVDFSFAPTLVEFPWNV
ncbi:kinase-like domain-containing protein [Armillaria borealis]|uniref:Kinase-like domain-containing protein n=1 Tax=Armillaria borealis TaxID=47425 RepID=A0AA39MJR9_9AGAR|nr:kinase-like domain-containing protein [Armillaria borealis]